MLWSIAAAGGLGLLLGLRYKVPALIVMSAGVSLLMIGLATHAGWHIGATVLTVVSMLLAMQVTYVIGLLLAGLGRRALRARRRSTDQPAAH